MTSGARAMTSPGSARMRSRANEHGARSGKHSSPPAISTSSETQRLPTMSGSSHSSKYTLGQRTKFAAAARMLSRLRCRSAASASAFA